MLLTKRWMNLHCPYRGRPTFRQEEPRREHKVSAKKASHSRRWTRHTPWNLFSPDMMMYDVKNWYGRGQKRECRRYVFRDHRPPLHLSGYIAPTIWHAYPRSSPPLDGKQPAPRESCHPVIQSTDIDIELAHDTQLQHCLLLVFCQLTDRCWD